MFHAPMCCVVLTGAGRIYKSLTVFWADVRSAAPRKLLAKRPACRERDLYLEGW